MAEVFAGFVCGYLVALLSTPLLALMLVRMRASSPTLERVLPPGVSALSLAVLLHGALFLFWTAVGLVLGMVLFGLRDASGGAGSPNFAYSLVVFALTLVVVTPLVVLVPSWRWPVLAAAVGVVPLFGWLMPYMAEWSKF